jgi:hypothetical protein
MGGHHALASWARGFASLSAALVLVLAFSAPPAEAAPFAYGRITISSAPCR